MLALILAAAWPLSVLEPEPYPCYPCNMPTQYQLPSDTQTADAFMVGRPGQFQDPYRRAVQQYPLQPTIPRYTVPLEEEIATNEIVQRNMARDVSMRGALLNQRINQKQFEYDSNIASQAESAINRIADLNPAAEDYEAQRAAFVKEFPLAIQNPGFNSMMGRLDQSFAQQRQATDILQRSEAAQVDRRNYAYEQMAQQHRNNVAQFGESFLKDYDAALATNGGDPTQAFATVASKINQERNRQLEDRPMTPAQVAREIRGNRDKMIDILKMAGAINPEDLTGLLKEQYDAYASEIASLQANPSNTGAPQAVPAKTAPPQSFFPKPSTKQGP